MLAVDEAAGALLLEAVAPGTALDESAAYPGLERLAALVTSLHQGGVRDPRHRPLAERVDSLFDSGMKDYERKPDLADLIPHELYARGRRLAMRLAADAVPAVLLHGDLTPVNVLDGGAERGLVAIDPAPCLGDPAFDAVDLVFFHAGDVETIAARAEELAPAIGADAGRLLGWCVAFAGMVALEKAAQSDGADDQLEALLALAAR